MAKVDYEKTYTRKSKELEVLVYTSAATYVVFRSGKVISEHFSCPYILFVLVYFSYGFNRLMQHVILKVIRRLLPMLY